MDYIKMINFPEGIGFCVTSVALLKKLYRRITVSNVCRACIRCFHCFFPFFVLIKNLFGVSGLYLRRLFRRGLQTMKFYFLFRNVTLGFQMSNVNV